MFLFHFKQYLQLRITQITACNWEAINVQGEGAKMHHIFKTNRTQEENRKNQAHLQAQTSSAKFGI